MPERDDRPEMIDFLKHACECWKTLYLFLPRAQIYGSYRRNSALFVKLSLCVLCLARMVKPSQLDRGALSRIPYLINPGSSLDDDPYRNSIPSYSTLSHSIRERQIQENANTCRTKISKTESQPWAPLVKQRKLPFDERRVENGINSLTLQTTAVVGR